MAILRFIITVMVPVGRQIGGLISRDRDNLGICCFLHVSSEGPNCGLVRVSKFQLTGKPVKKTGKVKNACFYEIQRIFRCFEWK